MTPTSPPPGLFSYIFFSRNEPQYITLATHLRRGHFLTRMFFEYHTTCLHPSHFFVESIIIPKDISSCDEFGLVWIKSEDLWPI